MSLDRCGSKLQLDWLVYDDSYSDVKNKLDSAMLLLVIHVVALMFKQTL